ncbi:MAG: hypothetical protein ABFE13_22490 [Phycisphaerales bacterium]
MSTKDRFEDIVRKDLEVRAGDGTYDRIHRVVLAAHGATERMKTPTFARRLLVDQPVVKLAIAAAVVAAVALGLPEFLTPGGSSGVVWADVAKRVEANRGFTFHQWVKISRPEHTDQITHITAYSADSRLRQDWRLQPEGPLFKTDYYDFDARTQVSVRHNEKTYLRVPMDERTLQSQQSGWLNPRDWVRQFLSSTYTRLGRRVIDGVACEGIETTNPTFGDANPPSARSVARLWVSVETGYPLRLECDATHATTHGDIRVEAVCDRFEWAVERSSDSFEPNIPPDYRQLPDSQ